MPFIDFAEASDLPEGVSAEALNSDAVQNFIKERSDSIFQNRFEVEASGLKRTNAELKEEKRQQKELLDKYKDIDLDEVGRLRELAKNNGDATKQIEVLSAEKAAMAESQAKEREQMASKYGELEARYNAERLTNRVKEGISEFNAQFPTVSVKPGTERWIVDEASKVFQVDPEGKYVPMDGERVMTGSDGNVMSFGEWVNSLRQRPDFASFFNQPAGGGASGNNGRGGQHFNPKNMGGTPEERKAAIAAKYNLPR